MAKHKNLQPWLDYFHMLHTYEEKGFLQIEAGKHEAYVTEPALYTLVGYDFTAQQDASPLHVARQVSRLVRRLRAYAAWKSADGGDYLSYPFALHTVKPDEPHDLLYTIVLSSKRRWWKLWLKHDHFEVIDYRDTPLVVTPKQDPPTPPKK